MYCYTIAKFCSSCCNCGSAMVIFETHSFHPDYIDSGSPVTNPLFRLALTALEIHYYLLTNIVLCLATVQTHLDFVIVALLLLCVHHIRFDPIFSVFDCEILLRNKHRLAILNRNLIILRYLFTFLILQFNIQIQQFIIIYHHQHLLRHVHQQQSTG